MSTLSVDTIQGKTTAGTVDFPSGTIVQQVNATDNGTANRAQQSTTSTSFAHMSNFDLAITPKFSSSKILYMGNFNLFGSNTTYTYMAIYRHIAGGSATYIPTLANHGHVGITQQTYMQVPVFFIDSPNTTNAVTYKVYLRSHDSGDTSYIGWLSGGSANDNMTNMIALEIRA